MPYEQAEEFIGAIGDNRDRDTNARAGSGATSAGSDRPMVPVTSLAPDQTGVISLLVGDRSIIQRLADLGLTQGTEVKLVRKTPLDGPVELAVRRTRLAVARDIADNIFVEVRKVD